MTRWLLEYTPENEGDDIDENLSNQAVNDEDDSSNSSE